MAEPVITSHVVRHDPTARGDVLVLRHNAPLEDKHFKALRKLGFYRRAQSGKKADGGPGHAVRDEWWMPLRRYEALPRLQHALRLLFLEVNGPAVGESYRAWAERLVKAKAADGHPGGSPVHVARGVARPLDKSQSSDSHRGAETPRGVTR